MSRIFICHASADKERFVRRLAKELRRRRHDVWFDEWTIQPGEVLHERITQGIGGCDFFLVVISQTSLRSNWVREELNQAVLREIEDKARVVIPLVIGIVNDKQIPINLRARRFVDFRRLTDARYRSSLRLLLQALRHDENELSPSVPTLRLPRCSLAAARRRAWYILPVITLGCFENAVIRDWKLVDKNRKAELRFVAGASILKVLRIHIDQQDQLQIKKGVHETAGWSVEHTPQDEWALKLEYYVNDLAKVSLYWISDLVADYLRGKLCDVTQDWDMDVIFARSKKR